MLEANESATIPEGGLKTHRDVIKVDGPKAERLILRPCNQSEVIVIFGSESAADGDPRETALPGQPLRHTNSFTVSECPSKTETGASGWS